MRKGRKEKTKVAQLRECSSASYGGIVVVIIGMLPMMPAYPISSCSQLQVPGLAIYRNGSCFPLENYNVLAEIVEEDICAGSSNLLCMSSSTGDMSNVRIRSAASALLKGGTLVSEPCSKCGGVQVKLAQKISCINCGYEKAIPSEEQKTTTAEAMVSDLHGSADIIENKIGEIASNLRDDKDIAAQRQKAELLEIYLSILERLRALSAK